MPSPVMGGLPFGRTGGASQAARSSEIEEAGEGQLKLAVMGRLEASRATTSTTCSLHARPQLVLVEQLPSCHWNHDREGVLGSPSLGSLKRAARRRAPS